MSLGLGLCSWTSIIHVSWLFGLGSLDPFFMNVNNISHILCAAKLFFPSNYVRKFQCKLYLFHFKTQICSCFVFIHAITSKVHFSELWVAQICPVAEWNFMHHQLYQHSLRTQASFGVKINSWCPHNLSDQFLHFSKLFIFVLASLIFISIFLNYMDSWLSGPFSVVLTSLDNNYCFDCSHHFLEIYSHVCC